MICRVDHAIDVRQSINVAWSFHLLSSKCHLNIFRRIFTSQLGTFVLYPIMLQGVPTKRLMPITEPESPALALKRRRLNASHQSEQEQEEKEETDGHVIKANPMPDMAKVFQPKLPHKKVETQPFSFEERDKNKPTRETFVEMILRKEKVNNVHGYFGSNN